MSISNQELLKSIIVGLSKANNFEDARHEWYLVSVHMADELDACLCEHPIIQICTIGNRLTHAVTEVGNVCVKRFMGMDLDYLFRAFERVAKNPSKALTKEAATYALSVAWLSDWEYDFCIKTAKKRKLTDDQKRERKRINARVRYYLYTRKGTEEL